MAFTEIDRTEIDAAVEDDGSGTIGDVLDKAWFDAVVFDPIDSIFSDPAGLNFNGPLVANGGALLVGNLLINTGNVTVSSGNVVASNGSFRATNGSFLASNGIFESNGVNAGLFTNDRSVAGKSAAFYMTGRSAFIYNSDYAGGNVIELANTGRVTTANAICERARTLPMGEWANVTFANTDFTGGGSMTVDVGAADRVTFKYMLIGKTMFVDIYLDQITIGGTPASQIFVLIPGGFLPAVKKQTATTYFDNGVGGVGYTRVDVANNKIEFGKSDVTAWTASSNNTFLRCSMFFEIQ